jgi:hypothetical protein
VREDRLAARADLDAGFDGVQVHAGNGFLLDQCLRDSSNQRRADRQHLTLTTRQCAGPLRMALARPR